MPDCEPCETIRQIVVSLYETSVSSNPLLNGIVYVCMRDLFSRQIKRKQDDIRNLVCILDVEPQFLIPTAVSRPLQ